MLEVALEDGVAGQDAAQTHRVVHSLRHLEHAVLVAGVNDHVENLSVRQTHSLRFALANYLKQLIGPEQLLLLLLLPKSATPHVDPA